MKNLYNDETFSLENFEGPLDFLLHLIQKEEIELSEISLQSITEQYIKKLEESISPNVDSGAEFIASTAFLLWLKSRMLLPQHENLLSPENEKEPYFNLIHHLLDFCRFKEMAKELTKLESSQGAFYSRLPDPNFEVNKTSGVDHLTIADLAILFRQALSKSTLETRKIQEEEWKVADKIKLFRQKLIEKGEVEVSPLFAVGKSKMELIVIFLALLELVKIGEAQLIKDPSSQKILLIQSR